MRPGYLNLAVAKPAIQSSIYGHPEFAALKSKLEALFTEWRATATVKLRSLEPGFLPKAVIVEIGKGVLAHFDDQALIDNYDVYQHLMEYWAATMQDDCYIIATDGWKPETYRILEKNKKGKEVDKGWTCDLLPKPLIVGRYFSAQQNAIAKFEVELENISSQLSDLEDEHGGDEGVFADFEKVTKGAVNARLKEVKGDPEYLEEDEVLNAWLKLCNEEATKKKAIKEAEAALDAKVLASYSALCEDEVKTLLVEDKWLGNIATAFDGEIDRISQALTERVKVLAERYESPLPQTVQEVSIQEQKVNRHLEKMGFSWA